MTDDKGWLTPYQQRVAAVALTLVGFVLIGGALYLGFWLARQFVTAFSVMLWPLATAAILALILQPLVEWLERHGRFSRLGAILVIYLVLLGSLAVAAVTVLPALVTQIVDFVADMPRYAAEIQGWIVERYPELARRLETRIDDDLRERLLALVQERWRELPSYLLPAFATAGQWIGRIVSLTIGLAIIPVYLFFMLRLKRDLQADLRAQLTFLRADWRDDAVFLIREFVGCVVAFFRGQLVIAMIMGVMMAIGFSLVGLRFGLVLGLAIGLLNIVPYLGSTLGLCTIIPVALLQPEGGWTTLYLVLAVFAGVQAFESNVLTPTIMGRSTGLHPLVVIVALFFWGIAFGGILGMIFAIPLTAFLVVAWRLMERKYLT